MTMLMAGLEEGERLQSFNPGGFVRTQNDINTLNLRVQGAKCGGCLSKIEGAVAALPGVGAARLNLSTGRMRIEWTGKLSARTITDTITGLGYRALPFDPEDGRAEAREERDLLIAMAVAGFATANIMLLSISVWAGAGEMGEATRQWLHTISGAIAVPTVLFAGRPFFRSAWSVLRKGHANMDVPISLAVLLALSISIWETAMGGAHAYFDACAMLLFFLLIGRFLDARLRRRAHGAARDLAALSHASTTRLTSGGQAESVRASDIVVGDTILVTAGERALVDLDIVSGTSDVDESLFSGESAARTVGPGARLHAGTIVLNAALTGRAVAEAEGSLLAEISRMLEAGEQRKSQYRRIADRAVALYVPLVHTVAAATFAFWIMSGVGLREATFIAISTLIITCPCALALAAPIVQVVAAGRLFRGGIYLKSGDALERLAACDHVVFDKTGTLTLGAPRLVSSDLPDGAIETAARLARASRHPLSRAVVKVAGSGPVADSVTEHPGRGLEGLVDGTRWRLGSAVWLGLEDKPASGPALWLSDGTQPPVQFEFQDELKSDARDALDWLTRRGLDMEIVSGDREAPVAAAAQTLGIETWTARASPKEKAARLERLRDEGKRVLMVGDGLNDAGALALAHASLVPGGAMDVSQSASDAVYSTGGLVSVPRTLAIAVAARRGMLQNFGLAAAYNMVAVPIAVTGHASPLVAAIAMSLSSVVVTLNALRLTFAKEA